MKDLDIYDYRKVNESFQRRLIYHTGIDSCFFAELNDMLNAMLFCLANGYRFQLYSEDANFGTGMGWTEYFLPFCEEVHEAFHHKYNLRRHSSWKSALKSLKAHWLAYRAYGEYVRLSQDVARAPDKYYHIPALGINCSYTEAYTMLAKIIWQPQPALRQQMSDVRLRLSLPKVYSGVHIRGGDKAMDARLISGWQVIKALHPQEGDCIFVLTDNYHQLEIVRNEYRQMRLVSLCQPHEIGYYHQAFCRLPSQEKRETIIRLLISVDILLHCRAFVGTITSGPSVFLMKVRARDPYVTAIDCPQDMLPDCLTLNIDDRADISRKSNGIRGTHVSPNNN